nr:uncharacterized protein LOC109182633 [Ipomoea batatas]
MSELCLPRKTWFSSLLISDLKQFCYFLLSQPLYLSYFVFFSPYLLKILSFLFPLVFTTSLLLLAFLTVSPGLIRKFLPHSKVGDLLSACHTLVEDGTQECFDLEDFEAYKIVFEGPITDVQESQAQFSEQSLVENSMESPKVESSRTLDYNLVSNGSMRKEKEWKRTLACKLYEERNTRDGSGEGMDLLWETYEMDAIKSKALKFSAGKVNLGMGIGKPNLMKISKAIKGFGWLHHVSSKHSKKVHIEDRL